MPSVALLTGLAQQLAGLERERAELSVRIGQAEEARLAIGRTAGPQSRAELGKLQDRVHQAAAALQGHSSRRAAHLDQLERAEGLLESCERSLQALSLAAGTSSGSEVPAAAAPPARAVAVPGPPAIDPSPEENEARELVRRLEQQQKAVEIERKQVDAQRDAARTDITRWQAEVEYKLDPANFLPAVNDSAQSALEAYLERCDLPPLRRVPARRAEDTRYASYLEFFTEDDANGALRLRPEVLDAERLSFTAFSVLAGAMMPGMPLSSLLYSLLMGNLDGILAALRSGGEGLEEAVRQKITTSFEDFIASTRDTVESARARPPRPSEGRRRRRFEGTHVSRGTCDEVVARNAHLLSLQEVPEHREKILDEAVTRATRLMHDLVGQCREADACLQAAQARLADVQRARPPVIERAVTVAKELRAARERRDALVNERRRREAAQAVAAPRPAAAAIPQTRTPLPAPDPEARGMKLRGDKVGHTDAIQQAREAIAQADAQVRRATAELRACEAALETAAAAHARAADADRRRHGEQRDELAALRRQLGDLDARILQARGALGSDPARRAMVSDHAWARAVERHVEPDHAALRARAEITGYAGVYASQADLALAVADIHAHLSQQPECRALLDAGTQDEFERAAQLLPGGVIDRVHDHGRPVGRGFSNHPDQTTEPVDLTRSCYSLQFVQGSVLVSHIYPQVPPRQLRTAP